MGKESMFVTIRQTQANGSHLFQVEGEDRVLFRAQTPWADVQLPFQMEHLRRLSFTDADGNEVFHTAYNVLENTLQSVSRYKYLFGSATKRRPRRSWRADGSWPFRPGARRTVYGT